MGGDATARSAGQTVPERGGNSKSHGEVAINPTSRLASASRTAGHSTPIHRAGSRTKQGAARSGLTSDGGSDARVKPGDRRVVRAASSFCGNGQWLGSWTPLVWWTRCREPRNRVTAGSRVVVNFRTEAPEHRSAIRNTRIYFAGRSRQRLRRILFCRRLGGSGAHAAQNFARRDIIC